MTQQDLAVRLNITDKAVSKWERGISCPDISIIPQLAEFLGIDANQLLSCVAIGDNSTQESNNKLNIFKEKLNLIFKAVAMALGISCLVLSIMGKLDSDTGFKFLSISVSLLGISLLNKQKA